MYVPRRMNEFILLCMNWFYKDREVLCVTHKHLFEFNGPQITETKEEEEERTKERKNEKRNGEI